MNRKETAVIAILHAAILVTILTPISPTPALALGHWHVEEDHIQDGELTIGGVASPDTHFIFPNLFPEDGRH